MLTDNKIENAKQKAKEKYAQYKNDSKYGKIVKSYYLSIARSKDYLTICANVSLFNQFLQKYLNDTLY